MLLSIVIPHYNLPYELLERCIASIVQQGIATEDYEIIVVDDASQVLPMWIEQTFPGINIRLIAAEHGGPGAARNRGMDEATGTYIQFIDADDMLIPGNRYKQCIEKLKEERPQILRFNYRVLNPGGAPHIESKKKVKFSKTISGAEYMHSFNLSGSPCTYFFERELAVSKGLRFPVNTYHEDEEFNTILHFHARTLVYSNATLYNYRIRQGSTTANSSTQFEERRINDMLCIIGHLAQFRDTRHDCGAIQRQGLEHKLTMLGVDAILNMLYNGMSARDIIAKCRKHLEPLGIYPLPRAGYSMKYRIFRRLANSRCGMRALRLFIPSKKPAKQ